MYKLEIPNNSLFNWIGGKKWLRKTLFSHTETILSGQTTINTYIEPFSGGLGSFLSIAPILFEKNIKNIILNDINKTIIDIYKIIQSSEYELLLNSYLDLENKFLCVVPNEIFSLNKTKDKDKVKVLLVEAEIFFKEKRQEFNQLKNITNLTKKDKINKCSLFLFLMEHCFNGVYRENSKGEYNSPFNWDTKKTNISNKTIIFSEYHIFFNKFNIEFVSQDALLLLENYHNKAETFIYLDPPYLNEEDLDKGISGIQNNKYSKENFSIKEQKKLLNLLLDYPLSLYSNHYLSLFTEFFNKNHFEFISVNRKNIMNSNASKRQNDVMEILAWKK